MNALRPIELASLFDALEFSPDPVFVTDRNNRIVFWNESASDLLGYEAEQVVGAGCASLLEGCDSSGNRYCSESCPVTLMAKRSEIVRHFDLSLKSKDRATVTVDVTILNFTLRSSDRFYLAHILKPSARHESHPAGTGSAVAPPRPALVAVRESPDARARKLTPREVEILGMLAAGHQAPQIAERLNISRLTARNHVQNILDKLEVHSKAEAVAFAFQKQLL